jgi:hypothetical protein
MQFARQFAKDARALPQVEGVWADPDADIMALAFIIVVTAAKDQQDALKEIMSAVRAIARKLRGPNGETIGEVKVVHHGAHVPPHFVPVP